MISKKAATIVSIIVVIVTINLDKVLIINDYFKAILLFILAGLLIIFEYKRVVN